MLAKLALMTTDDKTAFKGELGVGKAVAWSRGIPLDDVKFVKNTMGATVNDVLVAAVAGALRQYVEARGDSPNGKEIRAMVPVDIRAPHDTKLTNRFALVYLPLPIGIADPIDRLFETKRHMDVIKRSPEALVTYQAIAGLGVLSDKIARRVRGVLCRQSEYGPDKCARPGPETLLRWPASGHNRILGAAVRLHRRGYQHIQLRRTGEYRTHHRPRACVRSGHHHRRISDGVRQTTGSGAPAGGAVASKCATRPARLFPIHFGLGLVDPYCTLSNSSHARQYRRMTPYVQGVRQIWGRLTGIAGVSPAACAVG